MILKTSVLSSLALSITTVMFSTCVGAPVEAEPQISTATPRSAKQAPSEYDLPLDINSEAASSLRTTPVNIVLSIPHHSPNTTTFLAAYPYPVQPPKQKAIKQKPLDTNVAAIKRLITQTAYTAKNKRIVAYPTGGWRWQEAYGRALKRSGQMEPHILMNLYLYSNALLPYVYEEVKRVNDFEEKRNDRYLKAIADSKELRADAETEATRKGVEPQLVKYKTYFENGDRQGTAKLAPGEWWIVASHKVPGLTYYWEQPVTVHEGEPAVVTLSEENALLIEGAW